MVFLPALGLSVGRSRVTHFQSHGGAQIFGWAGLFLISMAFHIVPRIRNTSIAFPWPQRIALILILLAVFTVDDPTPLLLGDEPIFHDGVVVGRITSGAYGHTIGRSMGLDWIESEVGSDPAILGIGGYEIEIATERFTATGSFRPQYDPEGERIRA